MTGSLSTKLDSLGRQILKSHYALFLGHISVMFNVDIQILMGKEDTLLLVADKLCSSNSILEIISYDRLPGLMNYRLY